jgi:hypothetical protein
MTYLEQLIAAREAIIKGEQVAEVQYAGRRTKYNHASLSDLNNEIEKQQKAQKTYTRPKSFKSVFQSLG